MKRGITRRIGATAALALSVVGAVGIDASPVEAATSSAWATGWTASGGGTWVPAPPSGQVLGPPDPLCVGAGSQPGGSWAQFSFPNLAIPGGDVINGVEVVVDYETVGAHNIELYQGGVALGGSQKTLPANDGPNNCNGTSPMTVGGPNDTWGQTLSPSDFDGSAGSVQVRITQPIITIGGGDPGSNTIDIDAVQLVVHHGVTNTPPTAHAGGPYSVDEGGSVGLSAALSSDPDPDTLTYAWDLDDDGMFDDATGVAPTFSAAGRDGPDSQVVKVRVSDGTATADATATVTIDNVAPALSDVAATAADEDGTTTLTGTIADPGTPDTFTLTIDWGDPLSPGNAQVVNLAAGTTGFSIDHQYLDDNPSATDADSYSIGLTLEDDDGGSGPGGTTVDVANVAPVITLLAVTPTIDEDGTVTVDGAITDVGTLDDHSVAIDWGDGSSDAATVTQAAGSATFTATHQYLDDDPTTTPQDVYTITATATDDDTGSDGDTVQTVVKNVAPVITSIASDATFDDKAEEGEPVTVSGTFTDVGTLDTHTAMVDWGDGSSDAAVIVQGAGSGSFTAGHAYAAGGVFTVTVTLIDDDSGATTDSTLAVVSGVGVNGGVLQVVGTAGDDHVDVKTVDDEIDVFADFVDPKHRRFVAAGITAVELWLCEGDDHGNVHPSIDLPATIHGDAGDDMLWGGSAADFIEGGDGDDKLWGRGGDDELHGDADDDQLRGGAGTDILDGGTGNNKLWQ